MKNNYISKIAAVALTLLLILISVIPAFAAKAVKIKVEIAGGDGLVYVRLTAPASSNISTFSAALKYDSTKLKFKEMSYLEDASIINSTNAEKDGTVVANIVIAESLTEESKVFTYIFTPIEGNDGEYEFSFEKVKATNKANNEIPITFEGILEVLSSNLEPLTPDKNQTSFDPVTEPATSAPANADKPNVPNTAGKAIAISAVAVASVAAIGVTAVVIKKKREE